MITKESNIEKICSFYASEYHLEMIMLPYINKKINTCSEIIIMTQKSLKETIKTVIDRINLPQTRKQEILSLNWNNNNIEKIEQIKNINSNKELVIFIIGDLNYIQTNNIHIQKAVEKRNTKIIDCYTLEEAQENMIEILSEHSKVLNTTEEKELDENY